MDNQPSGAIGPPNDALLPSATEALRRDIEDLVDRSKASTARELFHVLHPELRRVARCLMAGERVDHTLQPTALVNEAYIRLARASSDTRVRFLALAAKTMRRVLVDYARARNAQKRVEGLERVTLDDEVLGELTGKSGLIDVLIIDDALLALAEVDPDAEAVAVLRFYGGLTEKEVAIVLGLTESAVQNFWRFARAWLARRLQSPDN
ncbi:MAG: ECF-type sigma factor [Candidatus Eisenbacteria bacterium]